MALDLSKYLDVKVEDVSKVIPSIPAGTFFAEFQSWKGAERDYDKKDGVPKTPVVEVTFKLTGATDDVDFTEDFPEGNEVGKLVTKDYRLNDPDKAGHTYMRRLCEDTCKVATKGLHFTDMLDAAKGSEVRVVNEPRSGQEEGQFFPNIKKVLPAEDE